MKKLPSGFHLQVSKSRSKAQGKWEISNLLDQFAKELSSREHINILNSGNPNSDPPLFSGSTLHLQAQKEKPKTSELGIRFHLPIVNKTIQEINIQLIPTSKLENKTFNVLIVYVSLKIILNPRHVIFVEVKIIFQFVIQKSKIQDQKNVPPTVISQQTPEKETEDASVNHVILSEENLIWN